MANAILMVDTNKFTLLARGCDYTLIREGNCWTMYVVNAAVRAWNNGYAKPNVFTDIAEIETKYKAWRGFAELVRTRAL